MKSFNCWIDIIKTQRTLPNYKKTQKKVKKDIGRERLLVEKSVNRQLEKINKNLTDLADKIQILEKGGLEVEETRKIKIYYLDIVNMIGLEVVTERQEKRRLSRLEESQEMESTLIASVRNWYKTLSKDPSLTEDELQNLQEEWEKKIDLLKLRANKIYQKISRSSFDERKLDDYIIDLVKWISERFKTTENLWQDPKAWTEGISQSNTIATMDYIVTFYVDNIKLEQYQRGHRVKSEVQGEILQQLRQVYIYR